MKEWIFYTTSLGQYRNYHEMLIIENNLFTNQQKINQTKYSIGGITVFFGFRAKTTS